MARTMRRAAERSRNPQKHHGGGKHRPNKLAAHKSKRRDSRKKLKAAAKAERKEARR